ncbi:DUF6268 family outer membrane beta-barrel protein [Flavobacterium sp.]|uniref:DUF6268 family outer membrane beta-barrel protein n=1 Tax=Flavobacterium sp. TaxID=239 RepID=UPI00260F5144|nr:DUF6268 family outer membrane beta-barrel protein [Flavobacterium sp.]
MISQEYNTSANYTYSAFYNDDTASIYRHQFGSLYSHNNWKYMLDINRVSIEHPMMSAFETENVDNILSIKGSLTYTRALNQKWNMSLVFAPQLVWFTDNKPELENIIPEASLSFNRKIGKSEMWNVFFGASYSTNYGKPIIFPIMSLQASIRKFDINIGIPETVFTYSISQEHSFSAWARTSSAYAKNNGNNYFYSGLGEDKIDYLEWFDISAGTGYTYTSHTGWETSFLIAKTLYNKFEMEGNAGNQLDVPLENNISFSLNFIYKFNLKK